MSVATHENATFGDVIGAPFQPPRSPEGALAARPSQRGQPAGARFSPTAQAQGAMPAFNFKEVEAGIDQNHHVAEGYDADILIRWATQFCPEHPLSTQ